MAQFFLQTAAASYNITAHTDARASGEYTMKRSYKRASSFARTTQSSGARIADVRGYCERMPAALNKTAHGMQQNYRVEIICIR